jgi:sugar lactone lactonase YvrE
VVIAIAISVAASVAVAYSVWGYTIWTIGGTGATCGNPTATTAACGDGGLAIDATFDDPDAVAVDSKGEVFIADTFDGRVREITPSGVITTVAGTGANCGDPTGASVCGDGGPARKARLEDPEGVAVDAKGDVFIADTGDNRIREVTPSGVITTFAGTGANCGDPTGASACGDGAAAKAATFDGPRGIAVDKAGDLFIADGNDERVREVTAGKIRTIVGNGTTCPNPTAASGACGDGGPAADATLNAPAAVALNAKGDLLIADLQDNRVREVKSGVITTVAGDGNACSPSTGLCGDGGPATQAALHLPAGVAVNAAGDVLIADTFDQRIREVDGAGVIRTVAGTGDACTSPVSFTGACGDGGAATGGQLFVPGALAAASNGDVIVADTGDNRIRWLEGPPGPSGPGGAPGPKGATGPPGQSGELVLVAFETTVKHGAVTVRYAITAAAKLALTVKPPHGAAVTVARATGHAGVGALSWNEKLHGKRAKHGRYLLTITATLNGKHTSSTITASI